MVRTEEGVGLQFTIVLAGRYRYRQPWQRLEWSLPRFAIIAGIHILASTSYDPKYIPVCSTTLVVALQSQRSLELHHTARQRAILWFNMQTQTTEGAKTFPLMDPFTECAQNIKSRHRTRDYTTTTINYLSDLMVVWSIDACVECIQFKKRNLVKTMHTWAPLQIRPLHSYISSLFSDHIAENSLKMT